MPSGLASVLSRYILFQLPELVLVCLVLLGLVGMDVLGARLAWGLLAVWLVKEVVVFPFVPLMAIEGHKLSLHPNSNSLHIGVLEATSC